jgi:glycosyltransferase involved in cell wall biosynthesis
MTKNLKARPKVLVLAPSLKFVGGVQNYTSTLIDALQVILGNDRVRMITVPGDPKLRDDGSLGLPFSLKLRFFFSAFAKAIIWSPDLMICAHVGLAPAAHVMSKLSGIPYWLVLYGIEVWGGLSAAKRTALRAAERYITITRFTLEATVARHGIKKNRAFILPPSLPKGLLPSLSRRHVDLGDPPRPIVLTVGRMAAAERYKGHDVMLEAWPLVLRRIPDAVYWIVGSGDDFQRLELRARELGIAKSVHFAGAVSAEELDVCYTSCRVFAMPARTDLDSTVPCGEGFGIVFLEAMAHGKPVVGPSVGAPAEFIRSGDHGLLVDPTDSTEIARALVELLEDPQRARRMGIAGREWVASEFSFERFSDRLRNGLQSWLSNQKRRNQKECASW